MAGIASLSSTARDMFRGPRGVAGFIPHLKDGGEATYRSPLFGPKVDRYIPPEVRQILGAAVAGADMLNPVSAYREYLKAVNEEDYTDAAVEAAGILAPGVAGKLVKPAVRAAGPYVDDATKAMMDMFLPTGAPDVAPRMAEGDLPSEVPQKKLTFDELRERARASIAEKNELVSALTVDDKPVRFKSGDLMALVSRSPDREGWRVTYFQPDGSPSGHSDAADKAQAVRRALDDQFLPLQDPRAAGREPAVGPVSPAVSSRGVSVEDAGQGLFRVSVEGQPAGSLQLSPSGDYMSSAFLNPEFTGRRYGVDAYDLVEQQIGQRLVPSPLGLSANAVPFWQRRLGQLSQEERVDVLQRAYERGIAAGAPERDVLIRLSSLLPRGDDLFAAVERSKAAARDPDLSRGLGSIQMPVSRPEVTPRFSSRRPLEIKRPSDNIDDVIDANAAIGLRGDVGFASVENLRGGVDLSDVEQRSRVDRLARQISGPEGYFERVIIDGQGNVVEGQHRLEAARLLGMTRIPVEQILAVENHIDESAAISAIRSSFGGDLREEQARQILRNVAEDVMSGLTEKYEAKDVPEEWVGAYNAALEYVQNINVFPIEKNSDKLFRPD